jgi:hypothetical protein
MLRYVAALLLSSLAACASSPAPQASSAAEPSTPAPPPDAHRGAAPASNAERAAPAARPAPTTEAPTASTAHGLPEPSAELRAFQAELNAHCAELGEQHEASCFVLGIGIMGAAASSADDLATSLASCEATREHVECITVAVARAAGHAGPRDRELARHLLAMLCDETADPRVCGANHVLSTMAP